MTDESLFPPLQEMSPDQFMAYSGEMLQTLVAGAVVERFKIRENGSPNLILSEVVENQGIDEYLEREKEFMKRVLESYERWSRDDNNVVLWDVDETMGKVEFVNGSEYTWHFRPAMQLLIPYLSIRYPSIKNGILTTRSVEHAMKGFDGYSDLLESFPFFDTSYIYSARDVDLEVDCEIPRNEREKREKVMQDQLRDRTDMDVFPAVVNKYKVMQRLDEEHPETKFRIVDDCAIADIAGESGLCVYYMQPNIWS